MGTRIALSVLGAAAAGIVVGALASITNVDDVARMLLSLGHGTDAAHTWTLPGSGG
ncbi:hypothetical protein [Arthrobacter sp. NPDC090010]|uniref:hypothetical protein n=1 Tax=Arthrobacter sp. NPDC090010 TaxID=3363942 RepID=UPI00380ECEFE